MPAWFYILCLQSGTLYVGATKNLAQRYQEHCLEKACRTTSLDPSIDIVYSEKLETFADARLRETQVKHWTRVKKEALISGKIEKLKLLSKSKQAKKA